MPKLFCLLAPPPPILSGAGLLPLRARRQANVGTGTSTDMIRIYNTLTRQKEDFLPPGSALRMFVCGPTVYDFAHLGHARTYLAFDVIARYLRQQGYQLTYLQNITDIDDKIIERARRDRRLPVEVAQEFSAAYFEDMRALGINSIDIHAPATQYLSEIISQTERLVQKGFAYRIEGDGFYFDLSRLTDYGKLSGRTSEQADDAISRIDQSVNKKNKGDFALWKFSQPGEPSWPSPKLGAGRPGWHIEDTAITEKHFGPQYELHGGARDLIFPHHEAEIAQMESLSGKKPFVHFWLHTGFLTINGQKMSKSLGNFITVRQLLEKHSPLTLRLLVLNTHYRSPIDYAENQMIQARQAGERLKEFWRKLSFLADSQQKTVSSFSSSLRQAKKDFYQALDDDFNTPRALAAMFDFLKEQNSRLDKGEVGFAAAQEALEFLGELNKILGVADFSSDTLPENIKKLVADRETARQNKDFQRADQLRQTIIELGYQVEDTTRGPMAKKV